MASRCLCARCLDASPHLARSQSGLSPQIKLKQSALQALIKPDAMHTAELLRSKSVLCFCTGGRCPGCHTAAAQEDLSQSGESCYFPSRHA